MCMGAALLVTSPEMPWGGNFSGTSGEGVQRVSAAENGEESGSGNTENPEVTGTPAASPSDTENNDGTHNPSKEPRETPAETEAPAKTPGAAPTPAKTPEASDENKLRLIFTTDIHGAVTNYNYQTEEFVNSGLNKEYTLIKKARTQAGEGNYLTFDLGDSVMDFNTDYIYNRDSTAIQPVYKAMKLIGYDAVTIGNHEMDYGFDYMNTQYKAVGLDKIAVVSNVDSVINGEPAIGSDNKIITKTLVNSKGKQVTVRVGIIGETVPGLSTRTESFTDKVVTEDIIANATKQAQILKAQGADIIVCIAHSGFGVANPTEKNANCAYALTKVPGIDVVLAGHEHIEFPNSNMNDPHYDLPNVDRRTGLVNGKRLLMVRDSCRGIGVVDLNIKTDGSGKPYIADSSYEVRKPTASTEPAPEISAVMNDWDQILKDYCGVLLGNIKAGERWSSYFMELENDPVSTVVSDTLISYASRYINTEGKDYRNLPIVSMANFNKYGTSGNDYADLSGNLRQGNIDSFANYHRYVYLYKITGAQLREWLEWTASMYEKPGEDEDGFDDIITQNYVTSGKGARLIKPEWQNSLTHFFKAGGVEYTIDTSVSPRYNYNGKKVANTRRITSMTINGQEISDSQELILVTPKITNSVKKEATEGLSSIVVKSSHDILQDEIADYIKRKSYTGDLTRKADDNFRLQLPDGYRFLFKTGEGSETLSRSFIDGIYAQYGGYDYYDCVYRKKDHENDTAGPNIVLAPSTYAQTNDKVHVGVYINDRSGISVRKYTFGNYGINDPIWSTAADLEGNGFEAGNNGVYSVYSVDSRGNASVEHTAVTNILTDALIAPKVKTVKNNTGRVKGESQKGLTAVAVINKKEYTATVGSDGTFSIKTPVLKAKKVIQVYVRNNAGRKSNKVKVMVKRVGPNCPRVSEVKNTASKVTGNLNDTNVKVYLQIEDNVYADSDDTGYFKKCDNYTDAVTLHKADISVTSSGKFTVKIPVQVSGTLISVYTVDSIGRVGHVRNVKVKKAAPNKPEISSVTDRESYVSGKVENSKGSRVYISTGTKTLSAKLPDSGKFTVKTGRIAAGSEIKVWARDKKGGKTRKSVESKASVESFDGIYANETSGLINLRSTKDNSLRVSGNYDSGKADVFVQIENSGYHTRTDSNGDFSVNIKGPLKTGSMVYVTARKSGKLKDLARETISAGVPDAPVIYQKITSSKKKIRVFVRSKCAVTVKTAGKKKTTARCVFSKKRNAYKYVFTFRHLKDGKKIKTFARNSLGRTSGDVLIIGDRTSKTRAQVRKRKSR